MSWVENTSRLTILSWLRSAVLGICLFGVTKVSLRSIMRIAGVRLTNVGFPETCFTDGIWNPNLEMPKKPMFYRRYFQTSQDWPTRDSQKPMFYRRDLESNPRDSQKAYFYRRDSQTSGFKYIILFNRDQRDPAIIDPRPWPTIPPLLGFYGGVGVFRIVWIRKELL